MAKKALKPPDLPSGARRIFFLFLQQLVVIHGDLPTIDLGALLGCSHQAVYKALTGPRMPSQALTRRLAHTLGGDSAEAEASRLWAEGVQEERSLPPVSAAGAERSPERFDWTVRDGERTGPGRNSKLLALYQHEGGLLTRRESEVTQLVTAGLNTYRIAELLQLSPRTVEYHLRNVYAKLSVHSRAELIALVGSA